VATYRFSAKLISRANGRSATAACAYRAGEQIVDYRSGEVSDYTRRREVLDRVILAPEGVPAWALVREQLWNAVEMVEKRKDAQVAREIQMSLPHELSLSASRTLLHDFVREQFVARGMIADVAIHAAHRGGDERNVHAHVLRSTRHITAEGFGGKAREWNERALLETWRAEWERHLNRALEQAKVHERVDLAAMRSAVLTGKRNRSKVRLRQRWSVKGGVHTPAMIGVQAEITTISPGGRSFRLATLERQNGLSTLRAPPGGWQARP